MRACRMAQALSGSSNRAVIRSAVPGDFSALGLPSPPWRVKAITVVLGDEVLGIGGVCFPKSGLPLAFVEQSKDAKRYPVVFHKAGLAAMAMIRELGLPRVAAMTDADNETAVRWLRRLGFVAAEAKHQTIPGKVIYLWERKGDMS